MHGRAGRTALDLAALPLPRRVDTDPRRRDPAGQDRGRATYHVRRLSELRQWVVYQGGPGRGVAGVARGPGPRPFRRQGEAPAAFEGTAAAHPAVLCGLHGSVAARTLLSDKFADVVRVSHLQHTVERIDGPFHRRRETVIRAQTQPVSNHLLEPAIACEPHHEAPTLAQGRVPGGRVGDPVLPPRDVAAAVVVQFNGQAGFPGSGQRQASYVSPPCNATSHLPATCRQSAHPPS